MRKDCARAQKARTQRHADTEPGSNAPFGLFLA
jgi:hypothetical protein